MFCRQCEQAIGSKACIKMGACGKSAETSSLQDLLIYSLKAISVYAKLARDIGIKDRGVDLFVIEGLFSTATNVNFNPERLVEIILESCKIKEKIKKLFLDGFREKEGKYFEARLPYLVKFVPAENKKDLIEQAENLKLTDEPLLDDDKRSLAEILLYSLKGMAAYADHAFILGKEDEIVSAFFHKGLSALSDEAINAEELLELIMEFGKVNLRCLQLLDEAHNEHFGGPVPTEVDLGIKKGPAIIVSGHDLCDLEQLLEQTKDKGINIYTHGEMLPSHGYPNLNRYKHLVGHFGSAWQEQQKEFDNLPVAILMTTNCIQKPRDSYKDRIFTTGLVSWPGVEHIPAFNNRKDFKKLIDKALELGGFNEDRKEKTITVGFGHQAVLGIAQKIIEAVKKGKIRHFFLIGGCDGAKSGRNYYTEFSRKIPSDCVILTLACGKFRFNRLDFGNIEGIPRLLDCGQCNDAYSAIKIALTLADAFECSVNELPLSLILSWYEQKAVCILLTLLSLGIENIRLGPSLPAFISLNVLKILIEKFNIQPITTPDKDLEEILKEQSLSVSEQTL
ncbi:MAG: hydroxylamine reductase [Candidatus Omnitrophota bacterium]